MKVIWKYPLQLLDRQSFAMPEGAQVLTVQTQRGAQQVWALVDPSMPNVQRYFRIYGTGHELPDEPGHYVGTFQIDGGLLVFHVFDSEALT